MKKLIYSFYKRHEQNFIILNFAQFVYHGILPIFKGKSNGKELSTPKNQNALNVKIAFICDDMTFADFCCECNSVFITPYNWKEVLSNFKPDILFCESAWSGISEYKDCWRGRIYKNHKVKFETRRELFKILEHCKKNNIKTVFWNKEDPTFFGNMQYDFVDTALKFEYIFTTAEECVRKYRAFGHRNVHTLRFGFSPSIFNPLNSRPNENKAFFAGSWYNDQAKRCEDMIEIFDMLENNKIDFDIIDRQSNSINPVHKFPEKYKNYIQEAIPFSELSQRLKKYRFAININTVTNSKTMFARRVFEMMAENKVIISNFSQGMKEMFEDRVWFPEQKFDFSKQESICAENLHDVFLNHTCLHRLEEVMDACGFLVEEKNKNILIVLEKAEDGILWKRNKNVRLAYKKGLELVEFETSKKLNEEEIKEYCFFMFTSERWHINGEKMDFLVSQFLYLGNDCGVAYREDLFSGVVYKKVINSENYNVLFDISEFKKLNENFERSVNKIYVI